ncbi:MAG: hypothetical protein H7A08_01185 [Oceanospirillaceae bacterium]|nr:hypothetical protein [Oceanospirillaceae bacterium]MCP5350573.1 hypothetical protein [Oceanospirillaceae bacterium]
MRIVFFICILCMLVAASQGEGTMPGYTEDSTELNLIAPPVAHIIAPAPFIAAASYPVFLTQPLHKTYLAACHHRHVRAPPEITPS